MREPIGINAHRLSCGFSWRELIFVDKWQDKRNPSPSSTDILDALMRVPCDKSHPQAQSGPFYLNEYLRYPIGKPTERDAIIAETVIQWLGTNVGQGFLYDVNAAIKNHIQSTSNKGVAE